MVSKIIWSPEACADLGNIAREIAVDRPGFAEEYCLQLIAKMESVAQFPLTGRKVPGQTSLNLRELILPPYRVIYELHPVAGTLDVLRVWDARRGDPEIARRAFP